MVYSSNVISSLASLFLYIEGVEEDYLRYDIKVDHEILIVGNGFIVLFKPNGTR